MLKSARVIEALEKTIRARIEDRQPTADHRATLGLSTMAYINLSAGNQALLPQFSSPRSEESLVQLLVELLVSSVQQRALFGINWRLKDVLWSLRVMAGNPSYFNVLNKTGLASILGMIQESQHVSNYHGQTPDIVRGLVKDIQSCLLQRVTNEFRIRLPFLQYSHPQAHLL